MVNSYEHSANAFTLAISAYSHARGLVPNSRKEMLVVQLFIMLSEKKDHKRSCPNVKNGLNS